MAEIPQDLLFNHIHPRLPAKSLVRFKCVCKPWQTFISTPEFISLHLHHALSSNTNHLLIFTATDDHSLHSCHLHSPKLPTSKLPFPTAFEGQPYIVGSCNGLVCVQTSSPHCNLLLVNPSTGIYKEVPSLRRPRRIYAINFGFGFDHVNDDYKVVRFMEYYSSRVFLTEVSRQVNVYSSRANSWRMVEWFVPLDRMSDSENGALVNSHLLHWKVWSFEQRKYRILCFDLCVEQWIEDVPLPEYGGSDEGMHFDGLSLNQNSDADRRDAVLNFGVFDGCLFLSTKNEQHSNYVGDVWVMKEHRMKESWVKLLSFPGSTLTRSMRMAPIASRNCGQEILLRTGYKSRVELFWYNIADQTAENVEFQGVADCFSADICTGSLVPIPGGYQIARLTTWTVKLEEITPED